MRRKRFSKNWLRIRQQSTGRPQKREKEDQKGAVLEFQFLLKKQGRAKTTYEPYGYSLEFLIANGANLFDPKSINDILYSGKLADKKGGKKYNCETEKNTRIHFRYWCATDEYQEYGKEGPVMLLLGHKTNQQMYKYVQFAHVYCGGSPKYVSKWISTDEEEINAVNEGWILVREEKENRRYLYKKQVSSAATIGHD